MQKAACSEAGREHPFDDWCVACRDPGAREGRGVCVAGGSGMLSLEGSQGQTFHWEWSGVLGSPRWMVSLKLDAHLGISTAVLWTENILGS